MPRANGGGRSSGPLGAGPALQPGWQLQRRVQPLVSGAVQRPRSGSAQPFV